MFYGRKQELNELNNRYYNDRFELGIVYGTRRIGKTSILKEFIKDKKAIYYQGKESNELDNRTSFSYKVNELLKTPYSYIYPTYSDIFDALIKYSNNERFIIVIDEVAFLAKSDIGFLSELQYLIDHKIKDTKIRYTFLNLTKKGNYPLKMRFGTCSRQKWKGET